VGVAPLAEKAPPNRPPVRLAPFGYKDRHFEEKGSHGGTDLPQWALNYPRRYSLTSCTDICLALGPKMVWNSSRKLFIKMVMY
jgi:hypothetical protein